MVGSAVFLMLFCCPVWAASSDYMPQSSPPASNSKPIPFMVEAPTLRPEGTGWDLGVYGGITPLQNGQVDVTSPAVPGESSDLSTKSRLGGVAGIRGGLTWPGFRRPSEYDPSVDAVPWVMPAVEYEFFWAGANYRGNDKSDEAGTTITGDLNTYTLSVDPMLKFRMGAFHPYIGLGIGGTYLSMGNGKLNIPSLGTYKLSGSSDDVDFSISPMIGAEIFVDQHWALTLEYKYLYIVDPTLPASGPLNYHSDGLGLQMMTAGLKLFF